MFVEAWTRRRRRGKATGEKKMRKTPYSVKTNISLAPLLEPTERSVE